MHSIFNRANSSDVMTYVIIVGLSNKSKALDIY